MMKEGFEEKPEDDSENFYLETKEQIPCDAKVFSPSTYMASFMRQDEWEISGVNIKAYWNGHLHRWEFSIDMGGQYFGVSNEKGESIGHFLTVLEEYLCEKEKKESVTKEVLR